ncbi:IgGFc-binding protein-like [Glandiceps talaboti]
MKPNCTVDVNECITGDHTCLNGGTCVNSPGTYTCDCAPGFSGDKCETEVDVCDNSLCENGASCNIDNLEEKGYVCVCGQQWQGEFCNIASAIELSPLSTPVFSFGLFKLSSYCTSLPDGIEAYALCYATGDPHYITFDERWYNFQGSCKYVFVEFCNGGFSTPFQVIVQNTAQEGTNVTYISDVFITVGSYTIELSQSMDVKLDNVLVHLPVVLNGGEVVIKYVGLYIVITTNFNTMVKWDGLNTLEVRLPPNMKEHTCGLCGDYNGDPADDFVNRDGIQVNTTSEFGNSWAVTSEDESCTAASDVVIECNQANQQTAETLCSVINDNNGPFAECGEKIGASFISNVYVACIYDACAAPDIAAFKACHVIELFAQVCLDKQVPVGYWRNLTQCSDPECPGNTEYRWCTTPCHLTCAEHWDDNAACDDGCVEGCECPYGMVFDGGLMTCVENAECGCSRDGLYYMKNESFLGVNCEESCMCGENGTLICDSDYVCPMHADCLVVSATRECVCQDGYYGNGTDCVDTNECASNPCHNGTCINQKDAFYCQCQEGYVGSTCDEFNYCYNKPCQNDGVCESSQAEENYSCECTAGYAGSNCEIVTDACYSQPCINGGTCTAIGNVTTDFSCTCREGFLGDTCETGLNACEGDPCGANGVCVNHFTYFQCICNAGFMGRQCDIEFGFCQVAGDPHYKTFDGEKFDFQGVCQYTLAKDIKNDPPMFEVNVFNKKREEEASVSYPYEVTVEIYTKNTSVDVLFEQSNVYVNSRIVNLPTYPHDDVEIVNMGAYVELITEFGLYVRWNGEDQVDVMVESSWKTNVRGMCGNYNGNTTDELVKRDNEAVTDVALFGNNWQKVPQDSRYPDCKVVTDVDPCQGIDSALQLEARANCSIITDSSGPFSSCHSRVDAQFYLDSCTYDICAYPDNGPTVICNMIAAYASACLNNYVAIRNWREAAGCPMDCPMGSIYRHRMSACTPSCINPEVDPVECPYPDIEGCECQDDTVLEVDKCVNITDCGCFLEEPGLYFRIGETVTSITCNETCTCTGMNQINCTSLVCHPKATCGTQYGVFDCHCNAGYEGDGITCTDIDECALHTENPCGDNTGTCLNLENRYECNCTAGYTGEHCEIFDDCYDEPCENGATCRDLDNAFECFCVSGYEGVTCDVDLDECASNPCQNEGRCFDGQNEFYCQCPSKYSGSRCEIKKATICDDNPCQNGGTCNDVTATVRTCACVPGFIGADCEQDVNDCLSDPCQNDATCDDGINEYTCRCTNGFTGIHCERELDDIIVKNITIIQKSSVSATITWDSTVKVKTATIRYRSDGSSEWIEPGVVAGDQYLFVLQGLDAAESYEIDIAVVQMDDTLGYGEVVTLQSCQLGNVGSECQHDMTSTAAYNLQVLSATTSTLSVSWEIDAAITTGQTDVHTIQYRKRGTEEWVDGYTVDAEGSTSELIGLDMDYYYEIRIKTVLQDGTVVFSTGDDIYHTCKGQREGPNCEIVYVVCSGWGDPHIYAYDDDDQPQDRALVNSPTQELYIQGNCTYTLAEKCSNDDVTPLFSIEAVDEEMKIDDTVSSAYTKEVKVTIGTTVISLTADNIVYVDGVVVTLPCEPDDGIVIQKSGFLVKNNQFVLIGLARASVVLKILKHSISTDANFFIFNFQNVVTNFGLTVNWNGKERFEIKLPEWLANEVCGICSQGDGFPDIADGTLSGCDIGVREKSPCIDAQDGHAPEVREKCNFIIDPAGPLSECHTVLSPQLYYDACVYDMCTLYPDDSLQCSSAEAYAKSCLALGIIVDWRTENLCPTECPLFSTYSKCSTACPPTCADPKADQSCDQVCVEGCKCNDGYLLDGDVCVEQNQCGCTKDGYYYSVGSQTVNSECSEQCVCKDGGIMDCTEIVCSDNARCEIQDGIRDCYCNEWSVGDGIVCTINRPYDIEVVQLTSSAITIMWKADFEAKLLFVRYRPQSSSDWTDTPALVSSQILYVIQELSASTAYEMQVVAVLFDGTWEESDVITWVTCEYGFEGLGCTEDMNQIGAFELTVEYAFTSTISLSWTSLVGVSQLSIQYGVRGESTKWTDITTVSDITLAYYKLTSLQVNAIYDIRVIVDLEDETTQYSTIYVFQTCPPTRKGPNCEDDRGVCKVYGDPHYITFDGSEYDFQGVCTYLLMETCKEVQGHPSVRVLVENNKRNVSETTSFTKSVFIYINDMVFEFHYDNVVVINGQTVTLPFGPVDDVEVFYTGRYVRLVLKTDFQMRISWDGDHTLFINIPPEYYNSTCGLCGNFDGYSENDYVDPEGLLVDSMEMFGDSWVIDNEPCEDTSTPAIEPCQGRDESEKQQTRQLCNLMSDGDGPFALCHAKIDPSPYVDDCIYDACEMSMDLQSAVCGIFGAYVQSCLDLRVQLSPWRNDTFCPINCPEGSTYTITDKPCPDSCLGEFDCTKQLTETCVCDDGKVWEGNMCINKTECGCVKDGYYYSVGDIFTSSDCTESCICNAGGDLSCKNKTCHEDSICSLEDEMYSCQCRMGFSGDGEYCEKDRGVCKVYGDPHYITFDGSEYDFQGVCTYLLMETCKEVQGHPSVRVLVENNKRNVSETTSFTKTVFIYINDMVFEFHYNNIVVINGQTVTLPFGPVDGVKVLYTGRYVRLVLKTDFQMRISWDGDHTLFINIPPEYYNSTCGLCGNFDGYSENDYVDPEGEWVDNIEMFGDSWITNQETCEEINTQVIEPCQGRNESIVEEITTLCSLMADPDGPFALCHAKIDPSPYVDDCIYDVCEMSLDQQSACGIFGAYVQSCLGRGVQLSPWRNEIFCSLNCPEGSTYNITDDPCPETCSGKFDCSNELVEACVCDDGKVWQGNMCINKSECGCTKEGYYYSVGDIFTTSDCTENCTCNDGGDLTCQNKTCDEDSICSLEDDMYSCECRMGFSGDGEYCEKDRGVCKVYGDPHYITFDGSEYDFQGVCTYVMAETCKDVENHPAFKVVVDNGMRNVSNTTSFTNAVAINIYGVTIRFLRNNEVLVNGASVTLPYTQVDGMKIIYTGRYVRLVTDAGLRISWDSVHTLFINVPPEYYNSMCGLCGNFDGFDDNDYIDRNNQPTESITTFGDSWNVDECQEITPTVEPCHGLANEARDRVVELCGIISNSVGPFAVCHDEVDPSTYVENCIYDVCETSLDETYACGVIENYVERCLSSGIRVKFWRNDAFCPMNCPVGSTYAITDDPCPESCSGKFTCANELMEACVCDDEKVWDNDICVNRTECGCNQNDTYYSVGETFVKSDCLKQCACDAPNAINCIDISCHDNATCSTQDGWYGCHCKPGFIGNGTHCIDDRGAYDITITFRSSVSFRLSWSSHTSVTAFMVQYRLTTEEEWHTGSFIANGRTTYILQELVADSTYEVQVITRHEDDRIKYSEVIEGTTCQRGTEGPNCDAGKFVSAFPQGFAHKRFQIDVHYWQLYSNFIHHS